MSRGLNKVMVIGNLGRDPEMRYTPKGKPVTTFSLGTTHTWKTLKGEKRTRTEWFNVVSWDSLAEICNQFLSKGDRVYIEGRLQTRHWEDKEGNKKASVEVVAREMIMLGNNKSTDAGSADQAEINNLLDDEFDDEDEFPF